MLVDTHAHLDEAFTEDLPEVLRHASSVGVSSVVAVGTNAASSRLSVELADDSPLVHAAVGIQPNSVAEFGEADWPTIETLASHPCVVAIGETGLDRYWDSTPFAMQEDFLQRHIELAHKHDLPIIIHMRECGDDIVRAVAAAQGEFPVRGVMHSFTGDEALMRRCLELGLYISFAGMVTFKKSHDLRRVACLVPEDRLLVETDSPYLSPEPVRKIRRNEPAHVVHTAQCLAESRGVTLEELADKTTANAQQLFRWE